MVVCWGYTVWQPFNQPLLPQSRIWLTGQVVDTKTYDKRIRLYLRHVDLYGLHAPNNYLENIHLSLATSRWEKLEAHIGDSVAAQAVLKPIPTPSFKGDYDPTQRAAIQNLAATGYVAGEIQVTHSSHSLTWWDKLKQFRQTLTERISVQSSPLAAAFLTGIRTHIPEEVKKHFRHAGLAHMLAISGLHLGMVGGMVFFLLRYLMTFWPRLALVYPTKKIAAMGALLASGGYMLLAGATVPTVRAFIMISLLLAAVMLGRIHLSLRLWSFAVIIVLLLWPESIVTASFQMSFTATLALILWAITRPERDEGFFQKTGYFSGIFAASLLAGLATMPLAVAHFGTASFSGFLLNLIAIPIMGFWILPAGLCALILMPIGWEFPALWVMEQGVLLLTYLARWGDIGWFGQWLGGWQVPKCAWPILACISLFGISGMVLHRKLWAITAVLLAAATCAVWPKYPPADIVLLDNGYTVLLCPSANSCTIAKESEQQGGRTWERFMRVYRLKETTLPSQCDGEICTYQLHDQTILITDTPTAEDCRYADMIISLYQKENCSSYTLQAKEISKFINLPS